VNQYLILAEFLLKGLLVELSKVGSDFVALVKALIRSFPNLVKMADDVARFATSLIGRALAVPITGVGEALIDRLRDGKLHNRVIRVDEAIRMFARGPEEVVQAITFTDETGLVGLMASAIGRFVYRFVKRFRLIAGLIAAKTEEEFIAIVLQSLLRRVWLISWAAIIVAAVVIITYLSWVWIMTSFCFVFIKQLEDRYILPQDSKRSWRKGGAVTRRNARRGPDKNG